MAFDGALKLKVRLQQDLPIPIDARFQCAAGEILGLIGPSGSGKTTILRAIAGLYLPDQGLVSQGEDVWLDTERGLIQSPQARRAGLVFQDYALFPHKSALENVALALGHVPTRQRPARAQELLKLVNMEGLEQRRPSALSGGQRQRVAVARALARDPNVLLLDEPFSAVDQATRGRLQRELLILRRNLKIPIILVTHDLREATSLSDRMALLYRGRILQIGTPEDIVTKPSSPQAARLVNLTNIFDGRVVSRAADSQFMVIDWAGQRLEVTTNDAFDAGDRVKWVIPPSAIVLHRRGRPSFGERENPVSGQVAEVLALGAEAQVSLRPDHAPELPLAFAVSAHAARRNGLVRGAAVKVSILADSIHLMPWESAD